MIPQSAHILAEVPQQTPEQVSGAGTAGVTLIVVVLVGGIWYVLKHKNGRPTHILMAFCAGVLMAGSVLGGIASATASSLNGGLTAMLSSVTSGSNAGGK